MRRWATPLLFAWVLQVPIAVAGEEPTVVSDLKITTLSTMLTEFRGVGEWGFAALVEVDGRTVLFDTGWRPDTVMKNSAELGIDLSTVDTVILSHNHAVFGGLHLLSLTDQKLAWTGSKMSEFGVQHLLGVHCAGINAVNLLRDSAGLRRDTSVVGAVGSVFTLEDGIRLGALNL